ncbi:SDR family oxidoreductase [Nocardiopsis sp. HNM0947]|uniref:SDR family oxidoreductase n=1 Tax=Nocardiopsis coralli TaxID=2772213 RepID=A0ABR9PAI3_9ACTN|nr:SDR family oxidoreductase [Nocardiopsis coralli]MBE3000839.1 SDR family oxidoreductase [Nocardiopsis coralli]
MSSDTVRTVVVTGGGTGIGRAVAEHFAVAGEQVHVVGRRTEVLERVAAGHPAGRVRVHTADLTRDEDVLRLAGELADTTVDVLVNNAGGTVPPAGDGLEAAFDAFRRTLDANLLSAMMLTEALWPRLRRPGGRVVSIGSIAANRGAGAYGAAKAGLVGWSHGLSARGGADGITANVVSPGYVQDTEFFNEQGRSTRHDTLVGQTLVGRAGVPADIASAVAHLASPEASWITGQVVDVNGGALLGR